MNRKYIIDTVKAPRAIGPYSQAVGYNGLLYVSGQTAIDTHTGKVSRGSIETQTRMVLEHLTGILNGAGLDFSHVLHVTIYLRNLNDFDLFDSVYSLYCDHAAPARSVVEVSRMLDDALIQLDCVAAAPADYEQVVDEPEPEPETHIYGAADQDFSDPVPDAIDETGDPIDQEVDAPAAPPEIAQAIETSPDDGKGDTLAGGWSPLNKIPAPKLPAPPKAAEEGESSES